MTLTLKWRKQRDSSLLCCHKKQQWQQKRQKLMCSLSNKKIWYVKTTNCLSFKKENKDPHYFQFFFSSAEWVLHQCNTWYRFARADEGFQSFFSVGAGLSINFIIAGLSKGIFNSVQDATQRDGSWVEGRSSPAQPPSACQTLPVYIQCIMQHSTPG